jgi:hypothetical protein
MRVRFAAAIFFVSMTGCASQPVHSKTASEAPPLANGQAASSVATAPRRVTLPYTFTRHGVEIRVTSIEFADNRLLVNATFQETSGQAADLSVLTLMQALSSTGKELLYLQYSRAGAVRTNPGIHVDAGDQFPISLAYQSPADSANTPGVYFELRFPTGKYWSSQPGE